MSTRKPSANDSDRNSNGGRRQALLLCTLALPLLIGLYALVLGYWARPQSSGQELRLDQFLEAVAKNRVGSATILAADDRVIGSYDGGRRYWVDFSGGHETLFARISSALETAGVPTTVRSQPLKSVVQPISLLLPMLILADVMVILALVAKGGGGALGGFGRAGARQVGDGEPTLSFADLAGADEAVEELAEIRDYLADPSRFAAMGAAVPKGVLVSGPPGCGKTRLARALAGESAVPFFSISGSDFVEMYVGVGAARIRDLFTTAKAAAPAIVFIDEIDAVGRARSTSALGANDEREATLNQLLVEMDGFGADSGVVVLAATNRPDILDAALLRPGRFDRRIAIDPPDVAGRAAILAVHARAKPLGPDVDLAAVARQTAGFSGADLANVLNEAALLATRRGAGAIAGADVAEAVERVVGGPQRRSRILNPADKARVATHEAGHAVVAASGGGAVAKVSVVARGHGQGSMTSVASMAAGDRILATRAELAERIAVLLGGRAAEELVWGQPSTGSNDDLVRATALARAMVVDCGMSEALGPLAFTAHPDEDSGPGWSDATLALIDAETRRIVAEGWARAREVLAANRSALAALAEELVAAETLEGEALAALLAGVVSPADAPLWDQLAISARPELAAVAS